VVGLLTGAGLAFVWGWLAARRRPTLDDRVAPYLGDAGWHAGDPRHGGLARLTAAVLALSWGRAQLRGTAGGLLAGSLVGSLVGIVSAFALTAADDDRRPIRLVPLILVSTVAGALVPDWRSRRAVAARRTRLIAELPTVAELLALAVAAGEDAAAALERVARVSGGELAGELGRALAATRAGEPLAASLDRLARSTPLPAVARFVDGLVVAIERGTPLADVLYAQAADARAAGRRALLEAGARKEVGMLIPVVFLVLPICVVFALYPAVRGLSIVSP
jgi:tight adherence protein C